MVKVAGDPPGHGFRVNGETVRVGLPPGVGVVPPPGEGVAVPRLAGVAVGVPRVVAVGACPVLEEVAFVAVGCALPGRSPRPMPWEETVKPPVAKAMLPSKNTISASAVT